MRVADVEPRHRAAPEVAQDGTACQRVIGDAMHRGESVGAAPDAHPRRDRAHRTETGTAAYACIWHRNGLHDISIRYIVVACWSSPCSVCSSSSPGMDTS